VLFIKNQVDLAALKMELGLEEAFVINLGGAQKDRAVNSTTLELSVDTSTPIRPTQQEITEAIAKLDGFLEEIVEDSIVVPGCLRDDLLKNQSLLQEAKKHGVFLYIPNTMPNTLDVQTPPETTEAEILAFCQGVNVNAFRCHEVSATPAAKKWCLVLTKTKNIAEYETQKKILVSKKGAFRFTIPPPSNESRVFFDSSENSK